MSEAQPKPSKVVYRCSFCGAWWSKPYCSDCRSDRSIRAETRRRD